MSNKKQIFVVPNPKWPLGVRDPLTRQFIKPEGEWKPYNTYWIRRIKMADVLEGKPKPVAQKAKNEVTEKAKKGES
jgi:hypothetical protein